MCQNVVISVFGDSGVGKHAVVAALNGRTYLRRQDRISFSFDATLAVNAQGPATIAVVVVDATNPGEPKDRISIAKASAPHAAVVITKTDLIAPDYHPDSSYLTSLGLGIRYSCYHDIECIYLNPTTLTGTESVMAFITDIVVPPPPPTIPLWERCKSTFLDWVATCFALPVKQHLPESEHDLAAITNDNDIEVLKNQPYSIAWEQDLKKRLQLEVSPGSRLPVHRITPALFIKPQSPNERASMEFVRKHTSIPIPRTHHPHLWWLVTDYIEGETLRECWPKLGWFMRFRVACTLRTYVQQLRALKGTNVGELGDRRVTGVMFQDEAFGPFDSARDFRRFCELVSLRAWVREMRYADGAPKFLLPPREKGDWSTVFVHGDLNASNILLDKHRTLWIVDWGFAGFYPATMETHAMRFVDEFLWSDRPAPLARYRPFIAGATDEESVEFWYMFLSAIRHFRPWYYREASPS